MSDGEISLYFDLKPDHKADLEVIAAATLRWAEAIRAAARELDPEATIKLELVDAQDGSLRLNVLLEWAEEHVKRVQDGWGKYPRLVRLALALAVFVPTVGYPTYDFYFGDEPTFAISAEDWERLEGMIERVQKNPGVQEKGKEFFRVLENDTSITGVGVAEDRKARPMFVVPNTEFAERGGVWALEEGENERTTYPELDVILIGPMLVPSKRAWTFQVEGGDEFTATMRDERFLAALEHDHVRERLRTGITMRVRLKLEERNVAGVWQLKHGGRSVIEVISPKVD